MKEAQTGRGGKRTGSGRKRKHSKGVAHRTREHVNRRVPLHINFKYKCGIRNKDCLRLLKRAILNARKQGLRILHFSLQHNHVHLIVEAETNEVLSSGMRSLTVTMAMGLKRGKIQIARYHLHVLKGLREARNAVMYVLFNRQKHEKGTTSKIDGYTSVLQLENWKEIVRAFISITKVRLSVKKGEVCEVDEPLSNLGKLAIKNPGLWPGFRMV